MQGRLRGTLIGLAVGDALGTAVEFKPPGTFKPIDGYRAGGPHGLEPGQWTDDTSMALALADSIIHAGWDLKDQANRYLAWWHQGEYSVNGRCFDIGNTVRTSLSRFEVSGDIRSCASSDDRASGNGSIMRLAPVPIYYADLFPDDIAKLDTTGAVCGQLAGAYWGEGGIPQPWLDGLAEREMIEQSLAGLLSGTPHVKEK